jgi:hypothetical protein
MPSPVAIVVNFSAPAEVDAAHHRRTVDAGCKSSMEPQDTFWNAHFSMLRDPFGYQWMLTRSSRRKTKSPWGTARRVQFAGVAEFSGRSTGVLTLSTLS